VIKTVINILQIALAFTVVTVVAEHNHLFAQIKGTGVIIALVLSFTIIGLKAQMRFAK